MKRILSAIDFSSGSLNALRVAATLSSAFAADLMMIHVCKNCDADEVIPAERDQQQKSTVADQLEQLLEKYQGQLKGKMEYKIRSGKVYKEVVNQARYLDAGLIVTGAHGISGIEEFFLGSNALRIVSAADSPVLTVNEGFTGEFFRTILLPVDLTRESRQKVPFTADLARAMNARVEVLGLIAYSDPDLEHKIKVYAQQAADHLTQKGVNHTLEFVQGHQVADLVLDHARLTGADLISIMSDKESGAIAPLLGGHAHKVINHSPVSVLVSHPREHFNYEISYTGVTG